ncbi:uncharacterized protein LOC111892884 isoform X1 [Lactuca sativa]|nr:uncharacterized protein LOC111892884 isoform X1 [Lactuca sativa]XP_042755844.1 uncharacterized protein LOC111892884 isoform X1 [Lactuca sativa]XP_042755846.1 uncharacterized protein LOC111892884 isoform X1 [Lactuca sativa]XP_052625088.1 uncharacterized protein LOC111892884 isoform X1 [Lactuca sativa]
MHRICSDDIYHKQEDESYHGANNELRELSAVEVVVDGSVTDQPCVTELILHDFYSTVLKSLRKYLVMNSSWILLGVCPLIISSRSCELENALDKRLLPVPDVPYRLWNHVFVV